MKDWVLPDGTKTQVRPKDGDQWVTYVGNRADLYIWEDLAESWRLVTSSIYVKGYAPILDVDVKINLQDMLKCECGNNKAPAGQGHSSWCDRYKREF